VQNVPVYVDGGEKDTAQPEPAETVDEEFDLSDIMSEEVAGGILSKEEQLKKVGERLEWPVNSDHLGVSCKEAAHKWTCHALPSLA
jgi:hypothetical protein